MCCMAVSVVPRSLSMAHVEVVHDIGTTSDETASNPRDSLSISAPNWCNAVMVDGVGSGILSNNTNKICEYDWSVQLVLQLFFMIYTKYNVWDNFHLKISLGLYIDDREYMNGFEQKKAYSLFTLSLAARVRAYLSWRARCRWM